MSEPRKRFVEQRLLGTMALASLVFGLIGGALLYGYGYSQEQSRSRHTLDSLAATVQSSAQIAVFVENDVISDDIAGGLLRNEEIRAVGLESLQGYSYMRWGNVPVRSWTPADEVAYPLYSPTNPEEVVGTLRLLTDSSLLTARARGEAFKLTLLLALQMVVLALIGVVAFRRLVAKPLTRLASQLRRVAPGSGSRFVTPPGHENSEIGLLAEGLNRYLQVSDDALASERALRERVESIEAHYRRIFESASVGVMVLDMDGRLINCNPVMRSRIDGIPGSDEADLLARIFRRPDKAWRLVERARDLGAVAAADLELVMPGSVRRQWVHCLLSVSPAERGEAAFIEAVVYDVTSRREREEAALRTAERDALTDLVNRRGAEAYIDRAIDEAQRNHVGLSLLYIDLDGFKPVNDTHGHAAGDAVLVEVAQRLTRVLRRSSDLVARLGGDEFVIAAYDCHKCDEAVATLAEAVLEGMHQSFVLPDGTAVLVGASIGIASYPANGEHRPELMYAADQAMYAAKQAGRDRYVIAP